MVNSKAIGGIVVGVVIVAIISAYAFNQEQATVPNEILTETLAQDAPVSVTDSVTLTQNNPDYEVDEEGNKKYIISASDSPTLED